MSEKFEWVDLLGGGARGMDAKKPARGGLGYRGKVYMAINQSVYSLDYVQAVSSFAPGSSLSSTNSSNFFAAFV